MPYPVECAHCGETFEMDWVSAVGDLYWCDDCRRLGAELWKKIGEYRTELARQEYEERQARWEANCAPSLRRGAHMKIRPEESANNKPMVDRYHRQVDPTRSRRAATPRKRLVDGGLRVWSDQTCSREEYFKMMDRLNTSRETEWLL